MSPVLSAALEDRKPAAISRYAVAWFGAILFACYAPVIIALVKNWGSDEDMGHGYFVPFLAAYIAWKKRDEPGGTGATPNWWGLAVVLYGGVQLYIATLGAELFLARTALVITLTGMVLFLGGTEGLTRYKFPLFLLPFMVPIPAVIYNQITFPLQILASRAAEIALNVIDIPTLREGNVLVLPSQSMNVAEACSGIRSLLSLTFLSLIYGFFFEKRTWVRAALFCSTVPIAIAANAGRVTLTGILTEIRPEWAEGFFHEASGWAIFMIALAMMVGVHRALAKVA